MGKLYPRLAGAWEIGWGAWMDAALRSCWRSLPWPAAWRWPPCPSTFFLVRGRLLVSKEQVTWMAAGLVAGAVLGLAVAKWRCVRKGCCGDDGE